MVIDGRGQVLDHQVVAGPRSRSLDRATLQMIRRAQPLPPPPPGLPKNGSLEVIAPFVYSLARGGRSIASAPRHFPLRDVNQPSEAPSLPRQPPAHLAAR